MKKRTLWVLLALAAVAAVILLIALPRAGGNKSADDPSEMNDDLSEDPAAPSQKGEDSESASEDAAPGISTAEGGESEAAAEPAHNTDSPETEPQIHEAETDGNVDSEGDEDPEDNELPISLL